MILVLGGTHETTEVCTLLNQLGLEHVLSVTTDFGAKLYGHLSTECLITRFEPDTLEAYITQNEIGLIIDATHPHASVVKAMASSVAHKMNLPYILYQRAVDLEIDLKMAMPTFESMAQAIAHVRSYSDEKTHILITGIKHIREWKAAFDVNQLYFRIMPSLESLKICLDEKIPAGNIVAIKAPCSIAFNQTLFKDFEIDYFVFKNSGAGSAFKQNIDSLEGTDVIPICIQPVVSKTSESCGDLNALKSKLESLKLF
ncbi:precorrin-6A/cobalt-precorrin-6A reductase [Fusibacter ferrireducens]|uniref:Precorrin-6A/cobalt-precorrin-6A reductase n=1 Tax=Fusibacter ferrireducens TaxID=2785058 RepID=A0ABR9ZS08_9FIRM|nr:precorrin-6A/cobalt-precorrin-6A reductase [Fusibacter ferrireducens]MBF4693250.1 precorrin-6A/cobalt-precorrin-6A reductase [Fusibacter ferrireducens]